MDEAIVLNPIKLKNNSNSVVNPATEDSLDKLIVAIRRLIDASLLPPNIDMATARARVTAILESGTVTTVSSVTNIAGIGGYQPQDTVIGANLTAWVLSCRERIS